VDYLILFTLAISFGLFHSYLSSWLLYSSCTTSMTQCSVFGMWRRLSKPASVDCGFQCRLKWLLFLSCCHMYQSKEITCVADWLTDGISAYLWFTENYFNTAQKWSCLRHVCVVRCFDEEFTSIEKRDKFWRIPFLLKLWSLPTFEFQSRLRHIPVGWSWSTYSSRVHWYLSVHVLLFLFCVFVLQTCSISSL